MHNIRHGIQISQHQAAKNGQCCANTEKKENITNDNGHYIVNFLLDTLQYIFFLRIRVSTQLEPGLIRATAAEAMTVFPARNMSNGYHLSKQYRFSDI